MVLPYLCHTPPNLTKLFRLANRMIGLVLSSGQPGVTEVFKKQSRTKNISLLRKHFLATNFSDNDMKRGERLIPVLIDELALTSPNQLFAKVPQEPNVHTSYRDVTISDLANAINHAAWWMEQHFGRSDSFETLSYAGPSDLRIITLIIAAVKTGHKV